jgi:hypothetical protein
MHSKHHNRNLKVLGITESVAEVGINECLFDKPILRPVIMC